MTMPGSRLFVPAPLRAPGALARRLAPPLLAVMLVVALGATIGAALSGCSRQPRFVPASADSSLAVRGDSLAEQVRIVNERWSAPGGGEEAARLTAQVLLQDLRARLVAEPRNSWEERARALLDSLDVGAEFASAGCALAVNFFSRSDPTTGSWPWVFWCAGTTVRAQAVEGAGMGLVGLAARSLSSEVAGGGRAPGVAALFARRAGSGQQPLLLTWRIAEERLELTQTLGPDSLGGVGTGAFGTAGDSMVVLTTRTWKPTPRFDECATCPHVFHQRRFRWGLEGFERLEDALVPTPYVTFVQLIQALTAGDREGAGERVTRPALVESARRAGWATVKGSWRAAPGSDERGDELVFYRGLEEAWKVRFERQGADWRVDSFEATTRVIE
jgi:hypothetical protein